MHLPAPICMQTKATNQEGQTQIHYNATPYNSAAFDFPFQQPAIWSDRLSLSIDGEEEGAFQQSKKQKLP